MIKDLITVTLHAFVDCVEDPEPDPFFSSLLPRISSGGAGCHDSSDNPVLRGLLRLHPSAFPSEAGREIRLHGHYSALVL